MSEIELCRMSVVDIADHPIQPSHRVTTLLFCPIFRLLKISGSLLDRTNRSKIKIFLSVVYCVSVTLVYLADALRYSTIYSSDQFNRFTSSQAAGVIVLTLFMWENPITNTGQLYLLTKNASNIKRAFDNYEERYSIDIDTNSLKKRRKKLFLSCIAHAAFIVTSTVCLCTFLPETSVLMTLLYGYHYSNYSEKIIPIILLALKFLIWTIANSSIVSLFREIVEILVSEFQKITRNVDGLIQNNIKADAEDMIEHYRRQHQALTDLLQTANPVMEFYVLITLAFGLPSTCFLVFGVASRELMAYDIAVLWYTLVTSLIGYLYVTRMGACLHSKAHEIRGYLLRLNLNHLSRAMIQQVHVFIAQVNGPPIGIHIYGMFVLDASSVLTYFGTILTYSIVIFQTSGPTQCSCDTSSVNTTGV